MDAHFLWYVRKNQNSQDLQRAFLALDARRQVFSEKNKIEFDDEFAKFEPESYAKLTAQRYTEGDEKSFLRLIESALSDKEAQWSKDVVNSTISRLIVSELKSSKDPLITLGIAVNYKRLNSNYVQIYSEILNSDQVAPNLTLALLTSIISSSPDNYELHDEQIIRSLTNKANEAHPLLQDVFLSYVISNKITDNPAEYLQALTRFYRGLAENRPVPVASIADTFAIGLAARNVDTLSASETSIIRDLLRKSPEVSLDRVRAHLNDLSGQKLYSVLFSAISGSLPENSSERIRLLNKMGIRISWLIFSLACNHRLHFPNGKTGWRGLEQMRKDCGTREFIAHPSVYLERSLSANLSDVPLTADNTRMEFST